MRKSTTDLEQFLESLAHEAQAGDRLPPIRDLMRRFGASQMVVQRVFQNLKDRGLIESQVGRGTFVLHSNKDLGASLASGSHRSDGMVIVPCSMKTMAGVAHGLSQSLIERAADVMLKEKRRLVLVP